MASRFGDGPGDGHNWFDRPGTEAERELAFETPDERLPWLQADEEGEDPPAFDTGRLVGIGLVMLVALAAIVAAVWFLANRSLGNAPEPDGSLIAAPDTPYKVRPSDPGGKTFAGTGDTSYVVGQGREVEGKLATTSAPPQFATPTPSPTPTVTPSAKPSAAPSAKPSETPGAASLPAGTAVQVGAYSTRADAEAGWRRLTGETEALAGVSYRIITGRADIGTVYRLQAVGGDKAGAQALCARLKAAGIACQVK